MREVASDAVLPWSFSPEMSKMTRRFSSAVLSNRVMALCKASNNAAPVFPGAMEARE